MATQHISSKIDSFLKKSGTLRYLASKKLKEKRFTFRQRHNPGFIHRRLDYFSVSNILQESIKKNSILTSVSTDHSAIFFYFSKNPEIPKGNGLWITLLN